MPIYERGRMGQPEMYASPEEEERKRREAALAKLVTPTVPATPVPGAAVPPEGLFGWLAQQAGKTQTAPQGEPSEVGYKRTPYEKTAGMMAPILAIVESIATRGGTRTGAPGGEATAWGKNVEAGAKQKEELSESQARTRATTEATVSSQEKRNKEKEYAGKVIAVMGSDEDEETKAKKMDNLMAQYDPKSWIELQMRKQGVGGGTIEWQINKLMSENPGMTWDEAFRRVKVPSTQYASSPEKLKGIGEEAEQRKLGGLTPSVTQAEIDQQNAIETAVRSGKLRTAADLKTLIDQIELGSKATERAQILAEEKKKESGSVTNIVASAEALLNNQPDIIGGGVSGGLQRGIAAGEQALTGKASAAKAHDQLMEANVSLAAKRITAQAGTLSDQDMERAKKLLPMSNDPIETYRAKLEFLKRIEDPSLTAEDKKNAMYSIYNNLYGGKTKVKKDPWE